MSENSNNNDTTFTETAKELFEVVVHSIYSRCLNVIQFLCKFIFSLSLFLVVFVLLLHFDMTLFIYFILYFFPSSSLVDDVVLDFGI